MEKYIKVFNITTSLHYALNSYFSKVVLFANAQVCDNCQLDFLCVEKKCSIMNYEKCQVRLAWKMVQNYPVDI